ncbi:universal stress protein [Calidifontibacillus erzurumensis]|uniref:Universal stress protein n=1 Tax=Calidifontibacillus erzurumensis TaxID=2741433 RepID=A0A8J8GFD6_9BACI|nr:universal stress protein [Calidifontibacillus erzurumensis]NSL51290.1 universal stress protein [Calidifontibacillus erzurumensis]
MSFSYKNILVAIDGSKESERAFKKAVSIAKANNAKLMITHVIDTRSFATVEAYDRTLAERAEEFATDLLESHKKEAEKEGVQNVETIVEYGSPKVRIAKEIAPKHNADLIVCGATGLNAVERFFIGSVSEHITRYAKCDVLVVRIEGDVEE